MRVSCSLILLAVCLALQSQAAPLDVATSPIDVSKVKLGSNTVKGVGRLTNLLFGRAMLPLDAHIKGLNLVDHLTHEVTPVASDTLPALPAMPELPVTLPIIVKRQYAALNSLGGAGSLPGVGSLGGLPLGQVSSLTSGLPGTGAIPSVPTLSGGGMPGLGGLSGGMPGLGSIGGVPGLSSMTGGMPDVGGLTGGVPGYSGLAGKLPIDGLSGLYQRDVTSPLGGVVGLAHNLPALGAIHKLPVDGPVAHASGVTGALPTLPAASVPDLEQFPQITNKPTLPVPETLPSLYQVSNPVVGAVPEVPSASSVTGLPLQSVPSVNLPMSLPTIKKADDLALVNSLPKLPVAKGLTGLPLQSVAGGLL